MLRCLGFDRKSQTERDKKVKLESEREIGREAAPIRRGLERALIMKALVRTTEGIRCSPPCIRNHPDLFLLSLPGLYKIGTVSEVRETLKSV